VRLASVAFVAFLGWNAGVGGRMLLREVTPSDAADWKAALTLGERQRVERWLARNEARYGFRPGYPLELLERIETLVPEDGIVNLMGPFPHTENGVIVGADPAAGVFPILQALCYPRLFQPLLEIPPGWPRGAEDYDPRIHILTFAAERSCELGPTFERIARGPDYVLWRCREGPP